MGPVAARHSRAAAACGAAVIGGAAGAAGPGAAGGPAVATVITHGYSLTGEKGVWIEAMAGAIIARGGGAGAIARYRPSDGAWQIVSGGPEESAPVVLIFRWLDDFEKSGPDWGFAEGAADALHAALRDPAFVDAGGSPVPFPGDLESRLIHLVGHSRGACVNSELAERLALARIPVDHVTSLDPHPVNGTLDEPFFNFDWGDPVPAKWSNVAWADNYWRADGGGFDAFDFDGIPIPLALNTELDEDALECCAYGFSHSDVHLWYHGTIDTSPAPCDGEECITPAMRDAWWPDGWTSVGYHWSVLGGGSAARPAQPEGAPHGDVESVYGGELDQGSAAGWLYHGGALSAAIGSDGGDFHLVLGAGSGTLARHNRLYLPLGAQGIAFDYRIAVPDTSGPDDRLTFALTGRDGVVQALGPDLVLGPSPTGWIEGHQVGIAPAVERGRSYTLAFQFAGGAALEAVVHVDGVRLVTGPPADVDGDGVVGVRDLLNLLAAWGPCPPTGACPADLDGDGAAGVGDLLVLLGDWG